MILEIKHVEVLFRAHVHSLDRRSDRERTNFLHLKDQEMKVRNRLKMKLNFLTENAPISLHGKDQEMKGRNA